MYKVMGSGARALMVEPKEKRIEAKRITTQIILDMREENPDLALVSGMAEGFDELIVVIARENNIPYICVIPTKDYGDYYWGRKSQSNANRMPKFRDYLRGAEQVIYLEEIFGDYTWLSNRRGTIPGPNYEVYGEFVHANMLRNDVMVGMSDFGLVYARGSRGTKDAVARMKQQQLPYLEYPFGDQLTLW